MRSQKRTLTAIFAVSGASGLIYEVAWMRTLRLLVGSTTLSHTIVLAAFMAGLALGAWIAGRRIDAAARPLRVYAWLEAAIGAYGLLFPLLARALVPPLGALYRAFEESPVAFSVGELLVLGPIVLPGAALMGATLPALGRVVAQENVAREGGWLYAVNTLGAAFGAAFAGFALLPLAGLTGTIVAAAATNFILSWLAFRIDSRPAPAPPAERGGEGGAGSPRLASVAVATSALAGMTLQIAWTKLFVVCVGSSTFAFTGVVAVYILGIGFGAALAVRLLGTNRNPGRLLAAASCGAALAAGLTPAFFAWFPEVVASLVSTHPKIVLVLAVETLCVALALGPATLLLGTIFPLGVAVAGGSPAQSGRALARISVASSVGSIVGALVGGLLLVRVLGLTGAVRAGALLAGAAGIFGLLASDLRRVWAVPAAALVGATLLLKGPDATLIDAGAFLYGTQRFASSEPGKKANVRRAARLVHHAEGEDLVAAIYERTTEHFLVVNGKIDASSHGDAETQRLVAHVPIFLHGPPVKRVAIVGLGSAMTAGAALTHPGVEQVDTIEISRTVVEAVRASSVFTRLTHAALDDRRHRVLIADGRTHIRHSRERYDVIVSEPTNPWIAGVGDLYTTEHFRNVKERLAPGGVFAQWLQAYGTTEELYRTIVRTFTDVFPDTQLWRFAESSDTLLVARREGGPLVLRFSDVQEGLKNERLRESLQDAGVESPEGLVWYFYLDPEAVRALAGSGVRNTDDSGYLEHRAPFALYQFASPLGAPSRTNAPFPELAAESATRIRSVLADYHEAVRLKGEPGGRGLAAAEALLKKVLASSPPSATLVKERYGAVLAERFAKDKFAGDAEKLAAFEEMGRLDLRSTRVLDLYAQVALLRRRPVEAEKALRRLIALRPQAEDPRIRLGEVLVGTRRHREALESLSGLPESADVLAVRALALAGSGDLDGALAASKKATALDATVFRAWQALGLVCAQKGDFAGARVAFEKVVELRWWEAPGWFQLALACFKAGDAKRAEECCRKALELDPNEERAKGLLEHMKR